MRRVLFLLPDLDYRGHSRQSALLAAGLPRDRFEVAIASLGTFTPLAESLAATGIAVHTLARGHRLDFRHWIALRALLRDWRPDRIHVWGLDALRTLRWTALLRGTALPPVILSLPPSSLSCRRLGWWERRMMAGVSRIIAGCEADRQAFVQRGIPADRIRLIRPGADSTAPVATLLLPPGLRMMSVGHMHGFGRMMDSIWVAEILSYVVPGLQLALVGDGSFKQRILNYFQNMPRIADSVHFLGARPDAAALISQADVALVPHRRLGGTFSTLEAMAAGRAVVATRLPHLEAIVRDGETGLLATPGDQPAIARACLRLLENEKLRQTLGAAARDFASREFPLSAMIAGFASTCDETA